MAEMYFHYLNYIDVQALAMTDAQIITAIETALVAQANGQTTIEPRMHLTSEKDYPGPARLRMRSTTDCARGRPP